jgi:SAM-dependent methyltransferase
MREIDFITPIHTSTQRDYLQRVTAHDKAECAAIARQWGKDYWDGARHHGYGGYTYDGRWRPVAELMAKAYNLESGMRVLDIGCGKAFLLYELTQVVPGLDITGIDISAYGLEHAKAEVKPFLQEGNCTDLSAFGDNSFDLVYSINTYHNLLNFELKQALEELSRVARGDKYICVEAYRDEREKVNLMYWQLTCEIFWRPEEWLWFYEHCGYDGDYSFIYFE